MTGIALCLSLYVSQKSLPKSSGKRLLVASLTLILISRLMRIGTITLGLDHPMGVFDDSITQLLLLATPALTVPLLTVSLLMIASDKIKTMIERENQTDYLTNTLNKKQV